MYCPGHIMVEEWRWGVWWWQGEGGGGGWEWGVRWWQEQGGGGGFGWGWFVPGFYVLSGTHDHIAIWEAGFNCGGHDNGGGRSEGTGMAWSEMAPKPGWNIHRVRGS